MTDPIVIFKLKEIFGLGHVNKQKRLPPKHDVWNWTCMSKEAGQVIEKILPYLILKKEQGNLSLKFLGLKRQQHGRTRVPTEINEKRAEYYNELRRLKTIKI